jgi:hypothetical protein
MQLQNVKREPQNIEFRITNFEGWFRSAQSFFIKWTGFIPSTFDFRYSSFDILFYRFFFQSDRPLTSKRCFWHLNIVFLATGLPDPIVDYSHTNDACYPQPLPHHQNLSSHFGRKYSDIAGQLMPQRPHREGQYIANQKCHNGLFNG